MPDGAGPIVDSHVHVNGRYQSMDAWTSRTSAAHTDGAVIVQQLGRTDNRDIVDAVAGADGRLAGVGIVDGGAEAERVLADGLRGLRLPPTAHGSAGELWEVLDANAGVASVTGPFLHATSDEFLTFVERSESVHFRFEHLAWLETGQVWSQPDTRAEAESRLRVLAASPRTSIMWSGFFHNSGDDWPYRASHEVLELTLELFGSERIMWSGDWNRAGLRPGDHADAIRLVEELPFVDENARADILGRTAARVFGLCFPRSVVG